MSSAPIRTLIAIDGAIDRQTLDALLSDPGIEVVSVVERHGELGLRPNGEVDAMLVACNGHADIALAYVAEAAREQPQWPVVVVTTSRSGALLRDAFVAGADDLLTLDDGETAGADTFFALQKAIARRSGAISSDGLKGELICILGPKGGTGKTVTTANLSTALAEKGHRVVAVDLDLQFGDLGLSLGVQPDRTLFDLATSGGSLDADKVGAYMAVHSSGLRLLMAPKRPDQASGVTADFLRELFPILRASADYVLVDTPPGFTPEVIATIDSATSICMVGMLDSPSLKNTRLGLETLELMGIAATKIRLVLNRADTDVGITHSDVVRVLNRAPDALVPSSRDVVRSVNQGEPIVLASPRSDVAKAYRTLAEVYAATATAGAEQPRSRRRRRGRA
jgi:pilus assembly protein CpaE